MTYHKRQRGFGVIGIIVLVAIVAVIGVGGWYVWSKQSANSDSKVRSKTTSTPRNPYVGWKSYCDSNKKVCFKYPADWTLQTDNIGATLQNPNRSIFVNYTSSDTRGGASMPYYPVIVEDLATPSSVFKVLGGYIVPTSGDIVPTIKVVDASFAKGLINGKQSDITNTARFTNTDGTTGHLEAYPSNASGYDTSKANAWFASDDGKMAELIIRTFYLQ